MKVFKQALDGVTTAVEWLLVALMTGIVVLLFAQVVFRYALNSPLMWAEQLARWMFVWITFLGASVVYRKKQHILIDVFVTILPAPVRKGIEIVNHIVIGALLIVFGYYGLLLTLSTRTQVFGSLQLPPSYIYVMAPVSSILMLLYTIESLFTLFRSPAPSTSTSAAPARGLTAPSKVDL